jgi:hypothetical protein
MGLVMRLPLPLKAYLHSQGTKLSFYMDEGRVVVAMEQKAVEQWARL